MVEPSVSRFNFSFMASRPSVILKQTEFSKSLSFLTIDDSQGSREFFGSILKNAELEVDIANNGQEAVQMVKASHYDLILMDIQMSIMDGMTATREIRSIPKFENLPILAMTAHAMSGDREMSLKVGMNDHISKPIDLDEMFFALAK